MIEELHIRGLGVIEDATVRLAPGLTVVTGETGAGKTMLVTGLELLLGARASTGLVRHGDGVALIEAVVSPIPAEASEWVDEGDQELVVSRELPADGRSRARIGGRLAPVSALGAVLGSQVEIHAQHDHVRLARSEVQRELLDRSAGPEHAMILQTYRRGHAAWQEARDRQARLAADARERARELDRLRAEVAEIEAADLDPEGDDHLDVEIERLAHAEELRLTAAAVAAALGGDGAQEPIGAALDRLRRLPVDDPELAVLRERTEGLLAEAADLAAEARSYGEQVDADPAHLEVLQARLRLVTSLRRKYGVDVGEILTYAEESRARLAALEADEADASEVARAVADARAALGKQAELLRDGRRRAAAALAEVVDGHLADLGMPHARFEVAVEPLGDDDLPAHGGDRITFLLAPNPGEPARPLAQAASGGERSRVSLAIEVALADVDDARVLVFDEVDAGIGGATAMAVGEKLATLAGHPAHPGEGRVGGDPGRARQVLCVTHLAQLAAYADVHHVVEKQVRDGRTVTTTRLVTEEERVAELARMLGGDTAVAIGREHARELLAAAQAGRRG